MRLRHKLLLAAVPSVVVVGALGAHATGQVAHLARQSDLILKDNFRTVAYMQRLDAALRQADLALLAPAGEAGLPAAQAEAARALELQAANITEPGEAEATRSLRASLAGWRAACAEVAAIATPARPAAWARLVRPGTERVHGDVERILSLNTSAMERKARETNALGTRLRGRLALLSLGAVSLTVLMAALLAARIASPLVRVTRAARKMGEGDLTPTFPAAHGDDEVAVLVRELSGLAASLRRYRDSSLGDLLAARETAQAAIDSLLDPVLAFGPDGALRSANLAATRLLGLALDQPDPLGPLPGELRVAVEAARDHVLRGEGAVAPEGLEGAVAAPLAGQARELQILAAPIVRPESGAIVGVSLVLRDVSALRRAQATKDDLLSTVAHELRTPLTSVRMAIHLCLEQVVGPITTKQEEVLLAARQDAERLHEMIEGLLRASRVGAGLLVARRRAVAPSELVEGAVAPHRVQARDRQAALLVEAEAEPAVLADPESAVMALSNLVGNALKHVPEGGHVTVRARPGDGAVRFEVQDDGPGIAPEHQRRIFERFYRVPGAPPGGVGLGLSIARDIALAHDGQIGLDSQPGQGATFWITLPLAPPQEEPPP